MRDLIMKIPPHLHELTVREAYELGWEHALANPAPPSPETGQDGWQPIETAPFGEQILIWNGKALVYVEVRYATHDDEFQRNNAKLGIKYWMPLPAPPTSQEEA